MTVEQRRLVRQSFDALRGQARPVALLFYGRLFELDPSARALFHNDLGRQAGKIMDTLAALAESIDRFDSMRGQLADLGRKHAGYGVRPEQYETVNAALLWAMGQALGPDFDGATRTAWATVLAAVAETMKAGAHSP